MCEDGIEKSIPRITVCHHSTRLVMLSGDPWDGLFYPIFTLMMDSYIDIPRGTDWFTLDRCLINLQSLSNNTPGHLLTYIELTFCSFHRIEQNICLVGTSINKGCAVYYYSVVMHGLRIIRYLWTKCREKSVLRRLHRREQHTKKRRTLVYISGVRR